MFADFQNQVWGGNSPLERENTVFGIDLAVSIMDGPDLSDKRRKELALARLMAETIGVIREGHGSRVLARLPRDCGDLERNPTYFVGLIVSASAGRLSQC
jgi:hypothetical protein